MTTPSFPSFLQPPPRSVTQGLRLLLLFGGTTNTIGWMFFGFGMLFFWSFGADSDWVRLPLFWGTLDRATGTVLSNEHTGSSENESSIYAVHYAFEARNEREYQGIWYTSGALYSSGENVPVEYRRDNPTISRIQGARTASFSGPVICFVSIFPIIGLAFLISGLRSALNATRLLSEGQLAGGTLTGKEPTGTRINKQPEYRLTFTFTAIDGQRHEATARTVTPYTLEDDRQEALLYDPERPGGAVLLDSLSGAPFVDDTGNLRSPHESTAWQVMILPTLVVLGNALALAYTLAG